MVHQKSCAARRRCCQLIPSSESEFLTHHMADHNPDWSTIFPDAKDHPETDYFETSDAMPAIYALGRISISWNFCEHILSTLIWQQFENTEKGVAVTQLVGNQTRADMLLNLTRRHENNPDVVSRIEFATKAFNRLRENRNILMHSHSLAPHDDGGLVWTRTSKSATLGHTNSIASISELVAINESIVELTKYMLDLLMYYVSVENDTNIPPLPQDFPIPERLTDLSLEEVPTG